MTIFEYGTLQAFATDVGLDIFFPYNPEIVELLKRRNIGINARWDQARRCWQATPERANVKTVEEVGAKIEQALLSQAPEVWAQTVAGLRRVPTVSGRFELAAGAGGLRLRVPIGHPCERGIKKIPGARLHEGKWYLCPQSVLENASDLKIILGAILGEDKRMFVDQVGFLEPRRIAGPLSIPEIELLALADENRILFADSSFIAKADANMAKLNVPVFPFALVSFKADANGFLFASLDYLMPDVAFRRLQERELREQKMGLMHEAMVPGSWSRLKQHEVLGD